MDIKEDDYIEHLFVCSTHDYLLFFTNRGKVYRSKVYDLPEASRQSKGRYLGNVLPLREGERVQSVLATRDYAEARYLVFATRDGVVKKTEFGAYNTPIKADGIIAIKIRDDDELVGVRRVDPGRRDPDDLARRPDRALLGGGRPVDGPRHERRPRHGRLRRRQLGDRRWTSRAPGQDLLVVTENGFGKRTSIDEYRLTSRGAKGVKTIQQTEVKGALAGALVVREHQELVFISRDGMVQRISVRGINRYGRAAQGVRLMNLRDDDVVSAVALVVEPEAAAASPSVDATSGPANLTADGGDEALPAASGDGVLAIEVDDDVDDEIADDTLDDDVADDAGDDDEDPS